jgi:hypothetical protein
MIQKIDNNNITAKLFLRKSILEMVFHQTPFTVFDAFHGTGKIWNALKKDFNCNVMGCDIKKQKGIPRIRSQRITGTIKADVYDLDSYGTHWSVWNEILKNNLNCAKVIFLTLGRFDGSLSNLSNEDKSVLGLDTLPVPKSLAGGLKQLALNYHLNIQHKTTKQVKIYECNGHGTHAKNMAVTLL